LNRRSWRRDSPNLLQREKEALSDWGTGSEDSGLPAWLTDKRPEPGQIEEPAEQPESDSGQPDWLSRVRARQQAEQQTKDLSGEISEEEEQTAAELPDWLSSFTTTEIAGQPAEAIAPAEFQATPPVVSPFTDLDGEGKEAFAVVWGLPGCPPARTRGKKEMSNTPTG
jgi:hypothetical protein